MKSTSLLFMVASLSCFILSDSATLLRGAEAPASLAAPSASIPETFKTMPADKLREAINVVGETIREKVGTSEEAKRSLDVAWSDPKYTSDSIEAHRKAIRAAEEAIIKAQMELRAEVAKLPDVVKMASDNDALQNEIASLRQQKKAMLKLLADRSRTEAPAD